MGNQIFKIGVVKTSHFQDLAQIETIYEDVNAAKKRAICLSAENYQVIVKNYYARGGQFVKGNDCFIMTGGIVNLDTTSLYEKKQDNLVDKKTFKAEIIKALTTGKNRYIFSDISCNGYSLNWWIKDIINKVK